MDKINGKQYWNYEEYLYVLMGTKRVISENKNYSAERIKKEHMEIDRSIDLLYDDLLVYGTKKVRIAVMDMSEDLPEYYKNLYDLEKLATVRMFREIAKETDRQLAEFKKNIIQTGER